MAGGGSVVVGGGARVSFGGRHARSLREYFPLKVQLLVQWYCRCRGGRRRKVRVGKSSVVKR